MIDATGLQHWEATPELLRGLKRGDRLLVRREPDNRFDRNAISVWLPVVNGPAVKLGYVPRRDAQVLAPVFDRGCHVAASVFLVAPGKGAIETWTVRVMLNLGGQSPHV